MFGTPGTIPEPSPILVFFNNFVRPKMASREPWICCSKFRFDFFVECVRSNHIFFLLSLHLFLFVHSSHSSGTVVNSLRKKLSQIHISKVLKRILKIKRRKNHINFQKGFNINIWVFKNKFCFSKSFLISYFSLIFHRPSFHFYSAVFFYYNKYNKRISPEIWFFKTWNSSMTSCKSAEYSPS
jgi:hypothetical protein